MRWGQTGGFSSSRSVISCLLALVILVSTGCPLGKILEEARYPIIVDNLDKGEPRGYVTIIEELIPPCDEKFTFIMHIKNDPPGAGRYMTVDEGQALRGSESPDYFIAVPPGTHTWYYCREITRGYASPSKAPFDLPVEEGKVTEIRIIYTD